MGFVTRLSGGQNPKPNSLMFGRKEWGFFGLFLVRHVYNQDVLVEHSLGARCSVHTAWPEAEFSHPWCPGCAVYQWSTQSLHLSDISGSIQMKRIPYMQSIPVFWKLQPCSWGLWRENHLESHVHSEHRLWFDNADSFQLNVGASRVLQEACPAPGFQQRYHFHTFSKSLLKCFCKCSIHGVGMCFVGG